MGVDGNGTNGSGEAFPLKAFEKRIVTDTAILTWCRCVALSAAGIHTALISSAVSILLSSVAGCMNSANRLTTKLSRLQPAYDTVIGANKRAGMEDLCGTVAAIVQRSALSAASVVDCCSLVTTAFIIHVRDDEARLGELPGIVAPWKEHYLGALQRVRGEIGEGMFEHTCVAFGINTPSYDRAFASACGAMKRRGIENNMRNPNQGAQFGHDFIDHLGQGQMGRGSFAKPTNVCGAEGCTRKGKKTCARCKLIKYCSAECQKNAWAAHKKVCTSSRKATDGAIAEASEQLAVQQQRLAREKTERRCAELG